MTKHLRKAAAVFVTAFLLCGLTACGGGDDTADTTVWNAGSSINDDGTTSPVYWKNGVIHELSKISAERPGYAEDIFINNDDIYVSGETFTGTQGAPGAGVACYWKNGQRVDLPKSVEGQGQDAIATGIAVDGGSIYVAGAVGNQYRVGIPVYWKDGVLTTLPVPTEFGGGLALGMHVSGSDIYYYGFVVVVGEEQRTQVPAYWKNGTLVQLSLPEDFQGLLYDLKTADGIVYTGGLLYDSSEKQKPAYWKNGVLNAVLPLDNNDQAEVNGLDVYRGDVYTAGWFAESLWFTPNLWKNNVRQRLSMVDESMFGRAYDVSVQDGDVYVTGWNYVKSTIDPKAGIPIPCNWKNGTRSDLPGLAKDPQAINPTRPSIPAYFGLWSGLANAPRGITERTYIEGVSRKILVR
jgi:hypothetical protein